jgi:hypothetical protein
MILEEEEELIGSHR